MKTELTDSLSHYRVADVTSTLEFLGGGDSVLPLSPWHKDSFWIEGTPSSDSRILLTDPTISTCSSSTTRLTAYFRENTGEYSLP